MGCGGGLKNKAVGPNEVPSLGEVKCDPSKPPDDLLIVEWDGASRAKLEAQLRKGVVPVRYDACKLTLVSGCQPKVGAHYVYAPTNLKQDRLDIHDSNELYASIPLGAATLAGELKKSGQLSLQMAIAGRWDSNRTSLSRDEIDGVCEQATHVITGITAGAFQMIAGAEGSVGGKAEVMGAGAGGVSKSGKQVGRRDGDEEACKKGSLDDKLPPAGCGALLRVELVPILAPKAEQKKEPSCPEGMALIPGGSYKRQGSGQEVSLAPFCMEKTEVSVGAYGECTKAGKCKPLSPTGTFPGISEDEKGWRNAFCPGGRLNTSPNAPASCLDWDMAVSYCWWKGRRLPSDVEFEWAARGGPSATKYPWGNDEPSNAHLCSSLNEDTRGWRERFGPWQSWLDGLKPGDRVGSCEVGTRPKGANPWGVQDLLGNVWEWVWSEKDGVKTYPVAGAGWNTGNARYVHAAGIWTANWSADSRLSDTGFRCVAAPR
jgi:formylglycine-generating enzyme required for sulfatase activity